MKTGPPAPRVQGAGFAAFPKSLLWTPCSAVIVSLAGASCGLAYGPGGGSVAIVKADCQNCYYRLFIEEWQLPYFCLRNISTHELNQHLSKLGLPLLDESGGRKCLKFELVTWVPGDLGLWAAPTSAAARSFVSGIPGAVRRKHWALD